MCDQHEGTTRRTALRAAATVATSLALLGPGLPAWADDSAAGADGPSADDPYMLSKTAQLRSLAAAADVETSYNGWPVGTPASAIGVANATVPGTSIVLPVRSGDVTTVLMYVADRFNREVETLRSGQCWGYDYRKNVNNPAVWSNHASGTAIDLNAVLHPNGAKNTFTASQVRGIRAILDSLNGVVYWGGDYRGTIDEMHFEINVPPGNATLTSVAAGIRSAQLTGPVIALLSVVNGRYVCADNAGASPLIANRTAIGGWEMFVAVPRGGDDIALRAFADNMFVCAEDSGASSLIANRTTPLGWEQFQLIRNSDGTVSLRARANNRIVCAEDAGASPLIANRDTILGWERFILIRL